MSATITGIVKTVGQTKVVGNNGFETRSLVVTTEEQYPQVIEIKFNQGKVNDLNNVFPGQKVTVDCNIRGREWVNQQGETVYFNEISGWRINAQGGYQQQDSQAGYPPQTPPQTPPPPAQQQPQRRLEFIATDATYEQYKSNPQWTDELLVQYGKARWVQAAPSQTPPPPAAPPAPQAGYPPQQPQNDLPF